MLSLIFNNLRNTCGRGNFSWKLHNIIVQHKPFSAKPPQAPILKSETGEKLKRPKTQPPLRVTLISPNDDMTVTTLEEAKQISKRRNLKLTKVEDMNSKTQRAVYKLMSDSQYLNEELEEKHKRPEKQNLIKGDKLLMLNSQISQHDLEINLKKITKWISKRFEVRVVIEANGHMGKAEDVYKFLEGSLKEHTRILQKRVKGQDIKFQIIPPKEKEETSKIS
ncbi:hypothetical protein FQA39_LY16227 [Lamprigera yunnana]|nr:hypothetical protein FQA39_LY16227 [Lamprigera yunnana]